MASLFPADLRGVRRATGPRHLAIPGSSSHTLYFLFRVRFRPIPAHVLAIACTFLGVFFPIATRASRVHFHGEIPIFALVPPTVFLTLSAVCSSTHLAGLFHPAATHGIHSSGVFPTAKPVRLSPHCALLSLDDFRLQPGCPNCPARIVPPSGR
jgi:hypothetical protein